MIKIQDNFLPESIYQYQKKKLIESEFEKVVAGGKDFHIVRPEDDFLKYILEKLVAEFNSDIELILGFFRLATNEIDTDWRIHSDLNINGQRPTHAGVLYFSEKKNEMLDDKITFKVMPKENLDPVKMIALFDETGICPSNKPYHKSQQYGTAFWSHKEYGSRLLPETTDEEYDKLLEVDANDVSKWELDSVVSAKENRLLLYEASLFHSKYPNKAWVDESGKGRIVLVLFFNVK